jgi:glycosyltransferase involved in cell wall biosynthesis
VPGALARADALICPFRSGDEIPLCTKIYEYCAAGKPILVYGNAVTGDLVQRIGNGRGCAAGDTDTLYDVLSDFTSNAELWRYRGMQGRDHAREHFAQVLRDQQWSELIDGIV